MKDEENPKYLFNSTVTKILAQIARGEIDPVLLAKKQLAARGVDENGRWIGYDAAVEYWGIK